VFVSKRSDLDQWGLHHTSLSYIHINLYSCHFNLFIDVLRTDNGLSVLKIASQSVMLLILNCYIFHATACND